MLATLPANRVRGLHRALAHALAADDDADPELLAAQWTGANEPDRAAAAQAEAADRAVQALAFDRAARLYTAALEREAAFDAERLQEIRGALVRALSSAGLLSASADALRKAGTSCSEASTRRMPRPPPPAVALISSG